MALSSGDRLGPYDITSQLGAGGMGEVYRARDTKLDRDVAIKVLPAALANDPDRLARFEREAKAVAALSHPNILAIHDFGVDGGVAYAVMELLRGASLRERLASGALPARKAVEVAAQIARGLAAAHDRGFVHRDLKPENIFLLDDGQVKILDFGLAKSEVRGAAAESATMAATDPGTVLGTVGYMAPEQVRGESVDARADLFALGAVLFETLTGRRAFQRDTSAETMTAILKEDPPDLVSARADLPPALDRIVRHCLEKIPAERFQTARDVAFALEALSGSGSGAAPVQSPPPAAHALRRASILRLAAGAVVIAAAATALGWWLRPAPPQAVRKLDLAADTLEVSLYLIPVISPDGRHVVYATGGSLWVRPLDSLDAVELADTKDAAYPSWSPDSRSIAYVKDGRLWRVSLGGGKGITLGSVPPDMSGSGATCWLPDGRILLAGSDASGITAISDRGGALSTVVEIDKRQEIDYHEMSPLPDGVLFTVHHVATQRADSIEAFVNGQRKVVLSLKGESLRRPVYVPSGYLVFHRESLVPGIWAVPLSLKTLEATGAPFLVVPGGSWPSFADDGTLAFVRPSGMPPDLVWIDRAGVVTVAGSLQKPLAFYGDTRTLGLAPDGRRALIALQQASLGELWMFDFASRGLTQVTHGAGQVVAPLWLPGGRSIIVSGRFSGRIWNVHRVSLDTGVLERLATSDAYQHPGGVTPDGRTLVFADTSNISSIWMLALDARGGAGRPVRLSNSQAWEMAPALRPDGKYMVYLSNLSGRGEVYLRPFPAGGAPRLVSVESGTALVSAPTWSRDGREILYRVGDQILSVEVKETPAGLSLAQPRPVASAPLSQGYSLMFDVGPDGRFLLTKATGHDRLALILNWPEDLRRVEAAGVGR